MPTVSTGKKGAGNGAVITLCKAVVWLRQRERHRGLNWTEFMKTQPEERRNPMRWAVEQFFDGAVKALAAAAVSFYTDPTTDGRKAWETIGLSDDQARARVWKFWGHASLFLLVFKNGSFERKYIQDENGTDLDDWASLFLSAVISTKWKDEMAPPPSIYDYMPNNVKADFPKCKERTDG